MSIPRWLPFLLIPGLGSLGGLLWWFNREVPVQITQSDKTFTNHGRRRNAYRPPRLIVIHHSATHSASKTHAVLEARGLSTHFEVTAEGEVIQYLDPAERVAWHALWANQSSIGIDLTHASHAPWPEVQVSAAASLVEQLCATYGIPRQVAPDGVQYSSVHQVPDDVGVLRHRNVRPTACPENFPMQALGPVTAQV